jgi:hypothetical protein
MTRKKNLSSGKFPDGLATGARGIICAWLFSLLIGCALPSASTPAHSRAQEVVVRPFSNNRVSSDLRTATLPNRMFRPTQYQESQVQSTNQQPVKSRFSDSQSPIQLASYQQDAGSRVYGTPTPTSASPDEAVYSGQQDWGYSNGSVPPRSGPAYPGQAGQMPPGYYGNQTNRGQPMRQSIEYGGATQKSYPPYQVLPEIEPGYGYRGQPASQAFNPHDGGYEFKDRYLVQPNPEYDSSQPSSAVGGRARGHFSHGPALQRSYLNPAIQTATEIAIDLKVENGKLQDSVARTQHELDKKMQVLAAAREESVLKDRELAKASNLESKLRSDIARLTAQLQIVEHEKSELRRQSDATLKEIESTLDQALFNNFSKHGD